MAQEKQYGLILPGKNKAPAAVVPVSASKKKNVFGDGDSSDEESNVDWVRQSLKKQSHGSMQQKQSLKVMKKALEDDPSVYEYDEVYDEMERKKEEIKKKEKGDKKPKYIEGLLKTAKQRELENELRRERLAQKEREDEGDEFEDKEAFVTAAYKKKMEDVRKQQEDQAHLDAVDDMTEVTKQKDLSGFYRYLFREKMKEETDSAAASSKPAPETVKTESEETLEADQTETSQEIIERRSSKSPDPGRPRDRSSKSPERRPQSRDRSNNSPKEKERRRDRQHGGDSYRPIRSRSRSGSYGREKRRRYESPQRRRGDTDGVGGGGRDRRDRSRSRDRGGNHYGGNKNRYDRHRRSRSVDNDDRDKRRGSHSHTGTDRHGRSSNRENHKPDHRNRYFDNIDKTKDRHMSRQVGDPHGSEKSDRDGKSSASTKASASKDKDKDSKIKIIQNKKDNWYDFDVEIEREVNKDFYSKRTVGQAFDDALQRYLLRKGPEQELDPKSKNI